MGKVVFQCEDSTDGIFTGIYDAWDSRVGHRNVKLEAGRENDMELFSEYRRVETDGVKAGKVAATIRRKLKADVYEQIYNATLSREKDKAEHIYRTVVMGLYMPDGENIMQNLSNYSVRRVFECSRRAGHEAHQFTGFLRFSELKNKVLFAQIEPENKVLPLIGDHFSDRFPLEDFLIYDKTHQMFLAHAANRPWMLISGEVPDKEMINDISENELRYRKLWKVFHRTIGIEERKNARLQQQLLPLRYRKDMTEWDDKEA